jgi:hypothetical protein
MHASWSAEEILTRRILVARSAVVVLAVAAAPGHDGKKCIASGWLLADVVTGYFGWLLSELLACSAVELLASVYYRRSIHLQIHQIFAHESASQSRCDPYPQQRQLTAPRQISLSRYAILYSNLWTGHLPPQDNYTDQTSPTRLDMHTQLCCVVSRPDSLPSRVPLLEFCEHGTC